MQNSHTRKPDLRDDARVDEHRHVGKKYVECGFCGGHQKLVALGINRMVALEGMARYWTCERTDSYLVNE